MAPLTDTLNTVTDVVPSDYTERVKRVVPYFRISGNYMLIINPVSYKQKWVDVEIGKLVKIVYLMSAICHEEPDELSSFSMALSQISIFVFLHYPQVYNDFWY